MALVSDAKKNAPPGLNVVEGLLPEAVSGGKQTGPAGIPDRKGKHAVQALETVLAPFLVSGQEDLRVAATHDLTTRLCQVDGEFLVVIDLAVEDDPG